VALDDVLAARKPCIIGQHKLSGRAEVM